MKLSRIAALFAVTAALLWGLASGAVSPRTSPYATGGVGGLSGGAPSTDALIRRFLAAIAERDRDALDAMRVSEAEYRNWIVPGSVAPGEPPQIVNREASQYFWELLDTKTRYYREAILADFGGKHLELVDATFVKGTKIWANHVAHGRLRLVLRDESGAERELRTGSVAEVDGQFKFISFIRD
jgi:hypothetical protein